jgi:hypothetical protein
MTHQHSLQSLRLEVFYLCDLSEIGIRFGAPLSVALEPYAHVGRPEQRLETRRQNLFLGDTIRYQPASFLVGRNVDEKLSFPCT